jgi:hypothetical protein
MIRSELRKIKIRQITKGKKPGPGVEIPPSPYFTAKTAAQMAIIIPTTPLIVL